MARYVRTLMLLATLLAVTGISDASARQINDPVTRHQQANLGFWKQKHTTHHAHAKVRPLFRSNR